MSKDEKADPAGTRIGRAVMTVAGIVTAFGLLLGAGKMAYENSSWIRELSWMRGVFGPSEQTRNALTDMVEQLRNSR